VIAVFNAGYFRNFLESFSFQADQICPQDCAIVEGGKFSGGDTPPLNRLLTERFFGALSAALEDDYATIKQGRSGRGS
jgi:hypothetical protein